MRNLSLSGILTRLLVAVLVTLAVRPASAQFGFGGDADPKVRVSGEFTAPQNGDPARLFVTATMEPGWHIYSITQTGKGPIPTQIRLDKSSEFEVVDSFQADRSPQAKVEAVFGNIQVESHDGTVVWHAPIRFAAGEDLSSSRFAARSTPRPVPKTRACRRRSSASPPGWGRASISRGLAGGLAEPPAAARCGVRAGGAADAVSPVAEPTRARPWRPTRPPAPPGRSSSGMLTPTWRISARVVGTTDCLLVPARLENVKKSTRQIAWLILLGAFVGG